MDPLRQMTRQGSLWVRIHENGSREPLRLLDRIRTGRPVSTMDFSVTSVRKEDDDVNASED